MVDNLVDIGGDEGSSGWNIVPSMDIQAETMNNLAASIAQDNLTQTPALQSDSPQSKNKMMDLIFSNGGSNQLQKTNDSIVTRAIANQGQLLPIQPAGSNSGGNSGEDLKKILSAISQSGTGSGDASSAPAASSGGGGGDGGIGGIISTAIDVISSWIICTELYRQGKMPHFWYLAGGPVFAAYSRVGKNGYYLWAIPSVRHMRRHPDSYYSKFLGMIFLWRAENIAAHRGVKQARKLWRGALVTAILYPSCHMLGAILWLLGKDMNWMQLYGAKNA